MHQLDAKITTKLYCIAKTPLSISLSYCFMETLWAPIILVCMFFRLVPMHWRVFIEVWLLGLDSRCSLTNLLVVFNWNHYFGLGPIPKPKMADTITTGQTKSKLVFSSQCFFQKMNVYIQLYYYDTSGWLVFVCFLEENGWFESGPWFQFTILKVVFGFTLPLGTLIS